MSAITSLIWYGTQYTCWVCIIIFVLKECGVILKPPHKKKPDVSASISGTLKEGSKFLKTLDDGVKRLSRTFSDGNVGEAVVNGQAPE